MGSLKWKETKKNRKKKILKKLAALTSSVPVTVQILRKGGRTKWEELTQNPRSLEYAIVIIKEKKPVV